MTKLGGIAVSKRIRKEGRRGSEKSSKEEEEVESKVDDNKEGGRGGMRWKRLRKIGRRPMRLGGKRITIVRRKQKDTMETMIKSLPKEVLDAINSGLKVKIVKQKPVNVPREVQERKKRSEDILRGHNIEVLESLPYVYGGSLRRADEVKDRLIILSLVNNVAFAPTPPQVKSCAQKAIKSLKEKFKIWDQVSPSEKQFLLDPYKIDHQIFTMQYRAEARWVLYWALNIIKDDIGFPYKMIELDDVGIIVIELHSEPRTLRKFREVCVQLTKNPKAGTLRSLQEIEDKEDLVYRTHWAMVNRCLRPHAQADRTRELLASEWHQTLGWLTSTADWDDVEMST